MKNQGALWAVVAFLALAVLGFGAWMFSNMNTTTDTGSDEDVANNVFGAIIDAVQSWARGKD